MKDEAKDIAIQPIEAQAAPDGEAATKTLATKAPAKKKRARSSKAKGRMRTLRSRRASATALPIRTC